MASRLPPIETVPLSTLRFYENNPRLHDAENKSLVRASLQEHGQYHPLIVRKATREVLIGNCRFGEMQELGWTECEVRILDVDEVKAKRLAVQDNRLSETSHWSEELLVDILRDLRTDDAIQDIGWSQEEVDALLDGYRVDVDQALEQASGGVSAEAPYEGPPQGKAIRLTEEQRETVNRVLSKFRKLEGDESLSEGRCVELILVDWDSGN